MSLRSSDAARGPEPSELISRAWRSLLRAAEESLLRNGLYIMGTTAITSLLGFGFWVIAARALPAVYVGRASALVSAMLFVAVITNLGLGQVMISRLGSRRDGAEWSLTVTTGLLAAGIASIVGGLVAALLIPALIPELRGNLDGWEFAILPLGVASTACSLVIDFVCIAERQARPSFLRNGAAALLRLALVGLAAFGPLADAVWLLAIWVGSFLVIDIHGALVTLPRLGRGYRPTLHGWRRELTEIRRLIAGHQTINLGSQATAYLLPVIVSARLGATENAYFYATFMLTNALSFIAPAIGNSLFAEGARSPGRLRHDLTRAIRYTLILAAPPALVLLVLGPTLLGIFGPDYASAGTGLLYVLVAAALFDAAYQLAIAVLRARHRLGAAAAATWALLIVGIASAWLLLPSLGLIGAGIGWGIGKACGLAVSLVLLARPPRRRSTAVK
ncbi:MAG TPA: lipopolysaccharide biosynthesis protein [Solirubrobacterales bacterium]|nr:lipopolysaccharide biosynthesis protein [Solirubrobacterales bacterium]